MVARDLRASRLFVHSPDEEERVLGDELPFFQKAVVSRFAFREQCAVVGQAQQLEPDMILEPVALSRCLDSACKLPA